MFRRKKKNHQSQSKKKDGSFLHSIKNRLLGKSKTKRKTGIERFLPKPKPNSFHDRHPKLIKVLATIFYPLINPFFRYLILIITLLVIVGFVYLINQLPSTKNLTADDHYAVSTQIFDRNNVLLYEIYADENRIPVKVEDIPEHVIQATIAIEDKNFYQHFGIDLQGVIRAIRNNLTSDNLEGGSTITQQLVKNALLTPERSFSRKIKEATLAVMTEIVYSKDQILEMYLNYISYGGTSIGIEAAAQSYFDKSVQNLDIAEAALLAGLPQAPSLYSPFGSEPKRASQRQAEVLRRMREEDFINEEQEEQAKKQALNYALSRTEIKAPHFVFYVRDWLYDKYGLEKVEKGGLRVYTTLDLELQNKIQEIVAAEIDGLTRYRVGNGAVLVTKPNTGEILAMVGSKDYFDIENDGQVNVTLVERQPGSSIKPLMYATTFQKKTLQPATLLMDVPTCFEVPYQKPYCPRNYNGNFSGMTTVRRALGNSLNIPAVKALATVGVEQFMDQAKKLGISTWKDPANYGLSLTLGGGEVKMIDMAQAFGTLANQGVKVPLTPITKIENYKGEVLAEVDSQNRKDDLSYLNNYKSNGSKGDLERVMDRAPAYLVSHIMQDNQARATVFGTNSALVIPDQIVSAKTGTTNDMKDNWTIGFNPEYLTVTWVGNNDNTPMSSLASGIVGAAPIFNDVMTHILQEEPSVWQEKPPDIALGDVCANGMPPKYSDDKCRVMNRDIYWENGQPSNAKFVKQKLWIDPTTGQPPPPDKQVDGLELVEQEMLKDPVTSLYCANCNRETNEEGRVMYPSQTVKIRDGKAVVDN